MNEVAITTDIMPTRGIEFIELEKVRMQNMQIAVQVIITNMNIKKYEKIHFVYKYIFCIKPLILLKNFLECMQFSKLID